MHDSGPMLKFALLFVVAIGWVYYRLIRSRRRRGQIHGRERLHERFHQRRLERLSSAETWEERRRLKKDTYAGQRIKPELLKSGDHALTRPDAAAGTAPAPAAQDDPAPPGKEGPGR